MKQSLSIGLRQSLAMTPQLQQAIRLLQLSTLELQTEVQGVLELNPMIELAEDEAGAGTAPGDEQPAERSDAANGAAEAPAGEGAAQEPSVEPSDIPAELPVDSAWDDIYDGAAASGAAGAADGGSYDFEAQRSAGETLKDYLTSQLAVTRLSETDLLIGTAIIDAIDDDGYLKTPLEELQLDVSRTNGVSEEPVGVDEVEAVLRQIQNFDPPGVAARDLRECLALQLSQLEPDTPWLAEAKVLVDSHLDALAGKDFNQLLRTLQLDKSELHEVIELVVSLNPRPGGQIESSSPQYVTPEVFVHKVRGVWRVELNTEALPRLRVNSHYANLIKGPSKDDGTGALKGQLQEARWFIKSLRSRSETLLKVATCIVERQQAFLEQGDEAMKPMVLADIAEAVGMHESTISRVTTQKYMHTPRGIHELKYFFSSHVYTKAGDECSSTAIRAVLKRLIADENAARPLSDNKLANLMSDQGIKVARRTIAKYREAMSIPSSSERRKLM